MSKAAVLGGGGLRTPLLLHGMAKATAPEVKEVALYDIDGRRAEIMARMGREIVSRLGGRLAIRVASSVEDAAAGADFVFSSIRVGGMAARARDERIAIEHGFVGQETTGPAGAAMALRTIPVALAQARAVERAAPAAWYINFTNPAGLIAQALTGNTSLRAVGICDTPAELFHRIAWALGEPYEEMRFEYAGLNHLGWVSRVLLRGEDITARVLADAGLLRRLHPADLFDPRLIQMLGLFPTEYLYFYYSRRRAYENLRRAGASRGEELEKLNRQLLAELTSANGPEALALYRAYLLRRNASYMTLEGRGESAFRAPAEDYDPFETATGYHRIAIEVMRAAASDTPAPCVVNAPNRGAIEDLGPEDVVETGFLVDRSGVRPERHFRLPEAVRGLVQSVMAYERTLIRAALTGSADLAQLALLEYPAVGDWEGAGEVLRAIIEADPERLGYLR
jgi:6-phospho-beta-glucosidase